MTATPVKELYSSSKAGRIQNERQELQASNDFGQDNVTSQAMDRNDDSVLYGFGRIED